MRNRRALSSVVGMVFAIIALTATIAYVSFSMNTLSQYNNAVMNQNQVSLNSGKERFAITSVTIPNGKFNITITNTGSLPINFTKIWVQDTTVSDWVKSYVPSNSFVVPGGTVTNIGQSIPGVMSTTDAYSVKLVTSRGNTQAFTVNSVGTMPLNIQLLTIPPTLPSGFTTQLVMFVTNNSTGVLANVIPQPPQKVTSGPGASTAGCTLGALSSNSYPTLQVGQTAVFSWPLTISGQPLQICTYKAQLQGSSQTVQATATVTVVSLVPATTYSQYSGVLTINYTSFRWAETAQGGTWHTGWQFGDGGSKTSCGTACAAFKINMTNNNSTGTFWLSQNSNLVFFNSRTSPSLQPTQFYIVNSTNPITMTSTTYGLCNGQSDYCLSIPPGGTVTVTFAAISAGGSLPTTTGNGFPGPDLEPAFLLVFGKFAPSQTGTGTQYAQNIPYMSAVIT